MANRKRYEPPSNHPLGAFYIISKRAFDAGACGNIAGPFATLKEAMRELTNDPDELVVFREE